MNNQQHQPTSLGFDPSLSPKMKETLTRLRFVHPTPIQRQSIPVALQGKDMVGIAQTGTGKTLAFGVPIVDQLSRNQGVALILVPTRELALQVNESLGPFTKAFGMHIATIIGGESRDRHLQMLKKNPRLIVSTPGRLIDYVKTRAIRLNNVSIAVLDEADMMLDMGFAPQINEILNALPQKKQMLLFSATMPPAIMEIATKRMTLPVRIEVAPAGTPAAGVSQEVIIIKKEDKFTQLKKMLDEERGTVLIFARTKYIVKNICFKLKKVGHTAAELHSNRTLNQRKEALTGFKNGKYRILVATDIAARGIDVKAIQLIINYDLPENSDDYVHRIGRTARAGSQGKAVSLALPTQMKDIKNIERLIKRTLPLTALATPETATTAERFPRPRRNQHARPIGRRRNKHRASFRNN